MRFLAPSDAKATCISVLTIGELRKGVAVKRKTDMAGADKLARWIDELEQSYSQRILTVSVAVSRKLGELSAQRSRAVVDTFLAATAIVNNLILVTCNTRDYRDIETLRVVNPWIESETESFT